MVKLARIRMGQDKILIHCFGQSHRSNLETPVQPKDIRYEFFMPKDAPKVSVTAPDDSVYVLNHFIGEKGVIIIGRDKVATSDAAYEIVPNGFRLDGPASAPIAPGEIVITRYDR